MKSPSASATMSFEPMIQFTSSTRPTPPDPYVFTEPPSIQTLQLHKTVVRGKPAPHYSGIGPAKARHNATESLKKKLGISTFVHAKPAVAQLIGGRNGRVTKKVANSSRSKPGQLDFNVVGQVFETTVPNDGRRAEKSEAKPTAKVPRKYTKRCEVKKAVDADLLEMPDDFWRIEGRIYPDDCLAPLHMRSWFSPQISSCLPAGPRDSVPLGREARLELKRCELRRRAMQLRSAQMHREVVTSRRRFLLVQSSLLQEAEAGGMNWARNWRTEIRMCGSETCQNEALIFTAFCPLHITQSREQQLFTPCTAKLADQTPCRVPVFDISHELPRCRGHARKVGGASKAPPEYRSKKVVSGRTLMRKSPSPSTGRPSEKMVAATVSEKPRAMPKTIRRFTNRTNAAHTKPVGPSPLLAPATNGMVNQRPVQAPPAMFLRLGAPNRTTSVQTPFHEPDDFVDDMEDEDSTGGGEEDSLLADSPTNKGSYILKRKSYKERKAVSACGGGANMNQTDVLLVSENSSTYESSEDTGVGGLSESEMIEEIGFDSRFLEDPEFNTVLEDLLSVEQHGEMFDAISVDDDVKINGTSTFLGDFLADQMLKESDAGHASHIFVSPNGPAPAAALQLHGYAQSVGDSAPLIPT